MPATRRVPASLRGTWDPPYLSSSWNFLITQVTLEHGVSFTDTVPERQWHSSKSEMTSADLARIVLFIFPASLRCNWQVPLWHDLRSNRNGTFMNFFSFWKFRNSTCQNTSDALKHDQEWTGNVACNSLLVFTLSAHKGTWSCTASCHETRVSDWLPAVARQLFLTILFC